MSSKTLGFVYTGLVMEMLHIMQSRLESMDIQRDAAAQIMGNFIPVLLNLEYVNNLFKNQQRSSISETPLRFRFEDCIAQSEDFLMSSTSFDILYNLMVMGFKRQVVMSSSIGELVIAMRRNFAKVDKLTQKPAALASLGFCAKQFISAYQNMPSAHSTVLQFSLMQFLQNHRHQVSIFIQEGQQLLDGSFMVSLAGPVPANANIPGSSKIYDEHSSQVISTNHNYFKLPMYLSCTPHLQAARLSFNVNAYQQQYPPFPQLTQAKKVVSHIQCQTDMLTMAALSDNWETRQKLQTALEQLGDCTESQAEQIASEERDAALKLFAEQEAARLENLQPVLMKQSRPLHLPFSKFDQDLANASGNQSREALQKIKEHVIQRDSVTRLRDMLKESPNDAGRKHIGQNSQSTVQTSERKLPKRVFDSLREPPKIIPQPNESLISLAEKLRNLDVANAEWASERDLLFFEEESAGKTLHQRLKQLPERVDDEKLRVTEIGTTYSLSYSLQNRQRNSGNV